MKKSMEIKFILGVSIILAVITGCKSDNDSGTIASNTDIGKTKSYLFVQSAASGTFIPDGNGNYILTLSNISPQTIFFSDRPVRNAGQIDMKKYISSGCFNSSNPPNAAIDVMGADKAHDVIIVELLDPKYDADMAKLQYTVRIVKDVNHSVESFNTRRDDSIPESFGGVAVFIDDCPNAKIKCGSDDYGYYVGDVECCTCWDWEALACGFTKNCCTFERCQRKCMSTYGKGASWLYTCKKGGWVNDASYWNSAFIYDCNSTMPSP